MLGTLGYLADKAFQGLIHHVAWRYAPTNRRVRTSSSWW
jgi:hypothetical protein